MTRPCPKHLVLLGLALAALVWSGIQPKDYPVWFMETVPAMAGLLLVAVLYPRYRLTDLVYTLIAVHCVILCIGGHYTYAEVPLFNWLRDTLHLTRNHYDRVGHFAQGFVPALIAREVLVRHSPLRPGRWLFFLVTCVCLAISALYELIEWWTAVVRKESAEAFLGLQGDVWDPQKDMFFALVGALVAQVLLARWHDRQLRAAGSLPPPPSA